MLTSFVKAKAANRNISEMAICFGLLAVVSIILAAVLGTFLHHVLGASNQSAVLVSAGLWLGFVIWLWVSLVLAGRQSPQERVSTGDLTAMQLICATVVGLQALLSPASEQQNWHSIGQVFEWVIVGFHIIYFSLAWAMRAPVPLKTYLLFAAMLSLAWLKS